MSGRFASSSPRLKRDEDWIAVKPASRGQQPPYEHILVRGVNWLGDAVMTTPALLRLREACPQAYISLMTPEKLADLWQGHPAVDAVLCFEPEETVWQIGKRLGEQKFDVGLLFPNSPRSALEVWLARIPRRLGYKRPWRNWLLTDPVAAPGTLVRMRKRSGREVRRLVRTDAFARPSVLSLKTHHLYHYLHLVSALGANPEPIAPYVHVSDSDLARLGKKFAMPVTPEVNRPVFALNPGAEYGPAKRWPAERFAAAAVEIHRLTNCRWIVLGASSDEALAEQLTVQIQAAAGQSASRTAINLAGKTTLRELCAALKLSRVLLTNDTGPMHVGAAVGTRVVALFGSTSAEMTGPGLPGERLHELLRMEVPCAPCFRRACPIDFRCMIKLEVQTVVEAVLRLAGRTSP